MSGVRRSPSRRGRSCPGRAGDPHGALTPTAPRPPRPRPHSPIRLKLSDKVRRNFFILPIFSAAGASSASHIGPPPPARQRAQRSGWGLRRARRHGPPRGAGRRLRSAPGRGGAGRRPTWCPRQPPSRSSLLGLGAGPGRAVPGRCAGPGRAEQLRRLSQLGAGLPPPRRAHWAAGSPGRGRGSARCRSSLRLRGLAGGRRGDKAGGAAPGRGGGRRLPGLSRAVLAAPANKPVLKAPLAVGSDLPPSPVAARSLPQLPDGA